MEYGHHRKEKTSNQNHRFAVKSLPSFSIELLLVIIKARSIITNNWCVPPDADGTPLHLLFLRVYPYAQHLWAWFHLKWRSKITHKNHNSNELAVWFPHHPSSDPPCRHPPLPSHKQIILLTCPSFGCLCWLLLNLVVVQAQISDRAGIIHWAIAILGNVPISLLQKIAKGQALGHVQGASGICDAFVFRGVQLRTERTQVQVQLQAQA